MRCLPRLHWEKTLTACFGGSEKFASHQQYLRHIRLPTLLEKKFGKLYLVDEVSQLLLKENHLKRIFYYGIKQNNILEIIIKQLMNLDYL